MSRVTDALRIVIRVAKRGRSTVFAETLLAATGYTEAETAEAIALWRQWKREVPQ